MNKYSVCFFESKKTGKRLMESAAIKPAERLKEINNNKKASKFILSNGPFFLVYHESYNTKKEADERIIFLKNESRMEMPKLKKIIK